MIAFGHLYVWRIVIMNIMLVSVTERTREVGIRKAMAQGDPRAVAISDRAVIFRCWRRGWSAARNRGGQGVTLAVGMPSVSSCGRVCGLIVAASVGVFFGVYPARRAQRSTPSWRCGLNIGIRFHIMLVEANS